MNALVNCTAPGLRGEEYSIFQGNDPLDPDVIQVV
jgi:hypothetical protein